MEWIVEANDTEEMADGKFAVIRELVRCKDCKYWKGIPSSNFLEWCNYRVMKTMAEFYCATGERR